MSKHVLRACFVLAAITVGSEIYFGQSSVAKPAPARLPGIQKATLPVTAKAGTDLSSVVLSSLSDSDMTALKESCARMRSNTEATSCLKTTFETAMKVSRELLEEAKKNKDFSDHITLSQLSVDLIPSPGRREIAYTTWAEHCMKESTRNYGSRDEPELYLREPSWCLSTATRFAEHFVKYDVEKVAGLQRLMSGVSRFELR